MSTCGGAPSWAIMPDLDGLAEVHEFLERNICRPWWINAEIQLGKPPGETKAEPPLADSPESDGAAPFVISVEAEATSKQGFARLPESTSSSGISMQFAMETIGVLKLQLAPDVCLTAAQ